MKIAVIGTGNVGRALGMSWADKGHQVVFGSRDPQSEKVERLLGVAGPNAEAATTGEAMAGAPVVVLAMPWNAVQDVVNLIDDWTGKVLIDCTNPIGPGLQSLFSGATSGAEQVASWAEGARVVKAFNTTGAENMADPIYDGQSTTMFICGDDDEAKAEVSQLAQELGFDVADTGNLTTARLLEPLALVWINLANVQGWGRNVAFKVVKRSER